MKGRGGAGQNPDANTRPLHSGAGGTDISSEVGSLLAEESTGWCIRPREGLKEEETGSSRRGRRGGTPRITGTFHRAEQTDCKRETGGPGMMLPGKANCRGPQTHREGHSLVVGLR